MRAGQDPSEPAFLRPDRAAASPREAPAAPSGGAGLLLTRIGLALFLGYFGALKLTLAEATAIQPVIENSPTLAWLYPMIGVVDTARILGVVELATALLLLAGTLSAPLAVLGSLLAVATFTVTLSFLATTPGSFTFAAGFPLPAPSATAAFVMKDVFLLGLAVWSLLRATRALRQRGSPRD